MNLLTKKLIFIKTGLLSLAILFFLGCKKENNKIGLNDPSRLPSEAYFTDTITVKSEVVLISDSINTTNVSTGVNGNSPLASLMMAGAYTDPLFGKISVEAYSRLLLSTEYIELPDATADSAFLYICYSYYYGNNSQTQTLNVYALEEDIRSDVQYFSNSPSLAHSTTLLGTATFSASSDSAAQIRIKLNNTNGFLQAILDASKNNVSFQNEIKGIVLSPGTPDGAIIRIDGNSVNTALQIYYTQYGQSNIYTLNMTSGARKFYRVTADRSGTELSSLVNNYDSINTASLPSRRCYIQACTGLRTRLSFPYLKNLREAFPNIAVIKGQLLVAPSPGTDYYPPNTTMLLMRTDENGKILKNSAGSIYYVQPDDYVQYNNTAINIITLDSNQYAIPVKSYIQSVLIGQIPNHRIILSPGLLYTDINRITISDNGNPSLPLKLRLYFTTIK